MTPHTYALDATWRPLLRDLGISPVDVLRRARLPEDLLSRPSVRLPPSEYYRFWESVEAESKDPRFPLTLCGALRTESFSPPLFAALCSPNFLIAARRISRYKALVAPMRLDVEEAGEQVHLRLAWPQAAQDPPRSLVAVELVFFVFIARMGTREAIRPLRVVTAVPPEPAAAFEAFFGVRPLRGPGHSLSFSRADALRPFLTANEEMWNAFEPELRRRLAQLDAGVTVAERVRAALLEALPSGQSTIDAIARRLAMSKRTLQRQIEAEHTTFQRILRETREALARHYLQRTSLPAAEIAFLLGFGESNSFNRAFRSWTGQTPDAVRRGLQDGRFPDVVAETARGGRSAAL